MKTRFLVLFCALSALATGCVVDNPAAYDPCKTAKDCSGLNADLCVIATQSWPGGNASAGLCTTSCLTDNGCSISFNGQDGYCSQGPILNADKGTCFERCTYHSDCSGGFVCADGKSVAGLPSGVSICVPELVGSPKPSTPYYSCNGNQDCYGVGSQSCIGVSQNWASNGGVVQGAICTSSCVSDASCPLSWNGEDGFCANAGVLNTSARTCFERCYYQDDCAPGFICADDKDVNGLPLGEAICVPRPTNPPKRPLFDTCTTLNDCNTTGATSATRCEELDPKWNNDPAVYQLNICTTACAMDSNCGTSPNGELAYCAPAGAISDMQVCVARCDTNADCPPYFTCAAMDEINGLSTSTTDEICVPDPYYGN